ncbi:MAG: hypothetical protein R2755_22270 [Acidimicrobiales bacterium]
MQIDDEQTAMDARPPGVGSPDPGPERRWRWAVDAMGALRLVLGTGLLAAGPRADRWLDAPAHPGGGAPLHRLLGLRDVAIGAATVADRRRRPGANPWLVLGLLADGADALRAVLVFRRTGAHRHVLTALSGAGGVAASAALLRQGGQR